MKLLNKNKLLSVSLMELYDTCSFVRAIAELREKAEWYDEYREKVREIIDKEQIEIDKEEKEKFCSETTELNGHPHCEPWFDGDPYAPKFDAHTEIATITCINPKGHKGNHRGYNRFR